MSETLSRSPSPAEVIQAALASHAASIRVALPGRVEKYNASTQTADIKPLLYETDTDSSDTEIPVSLPVLPSVPVIFPGAGGMRITFPIQAGDTVLLVFTDRSLDKWKAVGGDVDPIDARRHDLSDAVAIPGLHPNNNAWSGSDSGAITLGEDGGIFEGAARGKNLDEFLAVLKTLFNTHTHVVAGVTAGGAAVTSAIPVPVVTTVPKMESFTVKITP